MQRFFLGLFLIQFSLTNVMAQEMWGISNSNYAGNMGLRLNPSSIVGAPYKYDINIIALDVFAQNTYVYVPRSEAVLFKLIGGNVGPEKITRDNYNGKNHNAFGHILLIGPSYIRNKESTAWAIHTAYRNEQSVVHAPSHLSKFIYEKYNYPEGFGIRNVSDPFNAAWLDWAELGGTYGKVLRESEYDYIKAAASVNILFGFNGSYMQTREFEYTVMDTSLMVVHKMDATMQHSINPTSTGAGLDFALRGMGLGANIGATYIRKRQLSGFECRKSSDKIKKYNYRLGLSLMDLGVVRFFRDASSVNVNSVTDSYYNGIDSIQFDGVGSMDSILYTNINGTIVEETNGFSMITPTAISIQFDYSITPQVYANASWVNRIRFAPNQVARGNQFNLSMRYEVRRWEVNGNISLFEYQKPSMGIGFRYAFFIIGTDRLLEWITLSDVYGVDFFFGLKFNLCKLSLKNDDPDCPAFGSLY